MDLKGKRLHFMGIGGIGVSALALMAKAEGAIVSGCDRAESPLTRSLASRGVEVMIGHNPSHAAGQDLLVYTSAVPAEHPERLAANGRQEKRGAFLARFMESRESLGVSGTHGKTTTSWLLAHLLIEAGLDPAVFIGGVSPDLPDGNHRPGRGPFVAELDESDGSFLLPRLDVAIVTNIESDHLSHYKDFSGVRDAFGRFAANVADKGLLIAGIDDPEARDLHSRHRGGKLSFGFSESADIRAENTVRAAAGQRFSLAYKGKNLGEFLLPLPGRHNIQNALAALGAALSRGVDPDVLRPALAKARSVGRRLERIGSIGGAALYSDYAHHPTEVGAAIAALRQIHPGRVLVVFQPHLYSRTRDYADEFGAALATADAALVLDIYPAREEPIPGVSSLLLVDAARRRNPEVHGPLPLDAAWNRARDLASGFEAVVMMGAGDIDAMARRGGSGT